MIRALNASVDNFHSFKRSTAAPSSRQRFVMRSAWLAILLSLAMLFAGCSLRQGLADAQATEATIKTELGVDAGVNYSTFSGTGGTKHIVTVRLLSTPAGDATTIKTEVTDIVRRSFHAHIDRVDVSF